jgi:hypothetical protein
MYTGTTEFSILVVVAPSNRPKNVVWGCLERKLFSPTTTSSPYWYIAREPIFFPKIFYLNQNVMQSLFSDQGPDALVRHHRVSDRDWNTVHALQGLL